MNFVTIIFVIYALIGVFKHLNRHWLSHRKRTFNYDINGKVESLLELSLLGNGLKHYFREDGSVWKQEVYENRKVKEFYLTLYYPSGRIKYKSF